MPHSFTFVEIIYGFSLRAHRFAETTGDKTTEAHFSNEDTGRQVCQVCAEQVNRARIEIYMQQSAMKPGQSASHSLDPSLCHKRFGRGPLPIRIFELSMAGISRTIWASTNRCCVCDEELRRNHVATRASEARVGQR